MSGKTHIVLTGELGVDNFWLACCTDALINKEIVEYNNHWRENISNSHCIDDNGRPTESNQTNETDDDNTMIFTNSPNAIVCLLR